MFENTMYIIISLFRDCSVFIMVLLSDGFVIVLFLLLFCCQMVSWLLWFYCHISLFVNNFWFCWLLIQLKHFWQVITKQLNLPICFNLLWFKTSNLLILPYFFWKNFQKSIYENLILYSPNFWKNPYGHHLWHKKDF